MICLTDQEQDSFLELVFKHCLSICSYFPEIPHMKFYLIVLKMDKFLITMAMLDTPISTTMSMFPCMLADTTLITEVDELEITIPQLECVSGCSLLPITTLTCHILEEEKKELVMSTIHLSGRPYHCHPSIQLPLNVEMLLHSLECQFCDSLEQLLVQNSCHVKYSLAEVDSVGWHDIMVAMVLLSISVSCWSCSTGRW